VIRQRTRWHSTPKQPRSQARLARILDAAERVIADKGFEQATVAQIMAEAKSSVGLFYQRFKTKDDLLRCLLARFTEEAIALTDQTLDPHSWTSRTAEDIVAEVIPVLVELYRARRGLLRAFLLKASVDPDFHQQAHIAEQHVAQRLEELLLSRKRELRHPDPAAAVRIAYQMLRSTLNVLTLFVTPRRSGYQLDNAALADQLTRAVLAMLGLKTRTKHRSRSSKTTQRSTL
jgi:AcrR family transcriptional regulator